MSNAPVELVTALKALVQQLDRTQWATPGEIASSQFRHLVKLGEYCNRQSPFFATRLVRAGLTPMDLADPAGFARLPVMNRRDLQTAGGDLFCRNTPLGHGEVTEARTSGSTGEPVVVRRTWVTGLFWNAMAMRELLWHRRDITGRLCTISPGVSTCTRHEGWGPPAGAFGRTGPMLALPIAADVARLVEWIEDFRPSFLVIMPGTLAAVTAYCRQRDVKLPDMRQILTIGETLSSAIRTAAEETFGVDVVDCYSSEELGHIALCCPDSGLYHIMSESVIAEVLHDDGQTCREGEVGRVTLTALHNYATPIVRYDIGDVAEVAPPCPCGRGLPAWKRILGRERNLILMPDGTRAWPVTGFPRSREVAPVVQYQLVQEDRHIIHVRLVVERPLSQAEEDGLRALFHRCIGYPFTMRFTYFSGRLPAGPSGKFEEFVCNVRESAMPS